MEDRQVSLKNCSDDQVLSWQETTVKLDQFKSELAQIFSDESLGKLMSKMQIKNIGYHDLEKWLGEGIDCQILKPGAKGWQTGKVKLHVDVIVEFIGDESEVEET